MNSIKEEKNISLQSKLPFLIHVSYLFWWNYYLIKNIFLKKYKLIKKWKACFNNLKKYLKTFKESKDPTRQI
jgi:hypothetical protein